MEILPFTEEEFRDRIRRIRDMMAKENLDFVILSRPESIFYASGYGAAWIASWTAEFHALIIPIENQPRILCRTLESKATKEQWTINPILYADHEGPWKYLSQIFQPGRDILRIGIEDRFLSLRQASRLKEIVPQAAFLDVTQSISGIIAIPSSKEAEYIRKAGAITQTGFKRAVDVSKQGVTLNEIMGEIEHSMYRAGQSEQNRSLCLIWAGPTGGAMHTTDLSKRIEQNDLVTIEIWGTFKHYRAAAQGTLYVGSQPPQAIKDYYKTVSEMYVKARDAIRPNSSTGDVFAAANSAYRTSFREDYYRRIGGSMGLSAFAVSISKNGSDVLKPGMTFVIQPQVNEPYLITVSGTIMVTNEKNNELCAPLLELVTV